ncbi:MAG TPA: LysR family transcriptional regulator [Syntrophomonadaceae bacterium]|nr:LysR family transcriptional regulator [Syntrophomonadaceae bacterium]
MTIRHLRIFIAVYDELNMTAAAKKLFMTQPSISQAVKELEEYYGVLLFERLSRRLYVTESGEILYKYATHIIKLVDELDDNLKEEAFQEKLTIGANYTVGTALVHEYIDKFKNLYPDAEIRVVINKAPVLIEMLRKNQLDLALIEEILNESDLIKDYFRDDRIVIVAEPDHHLFAQKKVTAYDITNEHLLLREKGAGVRNLFELRMNEIGLSVKPYWESTSATALINAAINKMGIAVLPFLLVKEHIISGNLKELKVKDIDLRRKLTIVYHKNKLLTNAMQDFISICHES